MEMPLNVKITCLNGCIWQYLCWQSKTRNIWWHLLYWAQWYHGCYNFPHDYELRWGFCSLWSQMTNISAWVWASGMYMPRCIWLLTTKAYPEHGRHTIHQKDSLCIIKMTVISIEIVPMSSHHHVQLQQCHWYFLWQMSSKLGYLSILYVRYLVLFHKPDLVNDK